MAETKTKRKRKSRTLGGVSRDMRHKNLGVPLAANQLLYDIAGGDSPITEKSLTPEEMKILKDITKKNLAKGKNTIEYADYATGTQYGDVGGSAKNSEILKKATDPAYNLKTTLGQANINIHGNDTIVSDQYNFNNRVADPSLAGYLKSIPDQGTSIYGQARNLGKHLGSSNEGGSPVDIQWGPGNPKPKDKRPNVGNTDIPGFKFGGYIPGILQTAAGAALSIVPGGAIAGVPLMASGVGSIAGQVGKDKAAKAQQGQLDMATQQTAAQQYNANLDPTMLNRAYGGSLGSTNKGISEIKGGNGTTDSIKLGDIAMVDNNEVKFGDYIFSDNIEYDG